MSISSYALNCASVRRCFLGETNFGIATAIQCVCGLCDETNVVLKVLKSSVGLNATQEIRRA